MNEVRRTALVAGILVAGATSLAQGQDSAASPTTAPAGELPRSENSGQDPAHPLTRLDFRYKFEDVGGGLDGQVFTIRADRPFVLGEGWKLSTRIDVPFVYSDAPSGDNPNGDGELGLGDVLVQGFLIAPPIEGRYFVTAGCRVLLPTATQDPFGKTEWRLSPSVAGIMQLPELSRGSFVGLIVRDQFYVTGDSSYDANGLTVQPLFNWQLPERFFLSVQPQIEIDLRHGQGAFVPADLTVGWKPAEDIVLSVEGNVPVVDDNHRYDWQVEFRIGFFF